MTAASMYEPRSDTRVTSLALGTWLVLASATMLFGALFSSYVLLRVGSATWPDTRSMLPVAQTATLTVLLVVATWQARQRPLYTAACGIAFVAVAILGLWRMWTMGVVPAAHLMVACWYVLIGVHATYVVAGSVAAACAVRARDAVPAHQAERLRVLRLYWCFLDVTWVAIVLCFWVR
jgi:cytochrome c oxidase subunit III